MKPIIYETEKEALLLQEVVEAASACNNFSPPQGIKMPVSFLVLLANLGTALSKLQEAKQGKDNEQD